MRRTYINKGMSNEGMAFIGILTNDGKGRRQAFSEISTITAEWRTKKWRCPTPFVRMIVVVIIGSGENTMNTN